MKPIAFALTAALALLMSPTSPTHAAALSASEAPAEVVESIHIGGVIEVDARGEVERVTLRQSRLIPSAEKRIIDAMRAWRFEPFMVDGEARRIRTSVYVRLDQLKSSEGFQLVFGDVEFGQPLANAQTPPRYPSNSLRDGLAAEVLIRLTLDDTGTVAKAEPVMARVLNQRVRDEDRHRRLIAPFVESSLTAVQSWTYEFVEPREDGRKHELLVPVVYTVQGPGVQTVEGNRAKAEPVLFELSSPLGRPIEALARETQGRTGGLSIDPAPSPLKLLSVSADAQAM